MLAVLDGSFCNRTIFRAELDRVDLIARCRKKAKRPSALDLITLLRKEINETPASRHLGADFSKNLSEYAYT